MELLPCPFCGGTSVTVEEGTTYRWAVATCVDCGATASEVRAVPDVVKTQELALAEWNRRASPASVPEDWKLVPVEPTEEMLFKGHMEIDFDRNAQNTLELEHPSQTDDGGTSIRTDMTDAWVAMLAAAPTPPVIEDRWQPIETAPKDGTKFLAWRRHSTLPLIVHYNDEYSQWEDADGILVYGLTHWMPLPKAPAMQEDKP